MREWSDKDMDILVQKAASTHLTDKEMGDYYDGILDSVKRSQVDAHLRICLLCSSKYDSMAEALALVGTEQKAAPAAVAIPSPADVLAAFGQFVAGLVYSVLLPGRQVARMPGAAFANAGERFWDGQAEGGKLRWYIEEERTGDLEVRLGSHEPELEGCTVTLALGNLRKEVVLTRTPRKQVGGTVRITRQEREGLLPENDLIIEAIRPRQIDQD